MTPEILFAQPVTVLSTRLTESIHPITLFEGLDLEKATHADVAARLWYVAPRDVLGFWVGNEPMWFASWFLKDSDGQVMSRTSYEVFQTRRDAVKGLFAMVNGSPVQDLTFFDSFKDAGQFGRVRLVFPTEEMANMFHPDVQSLFGQHASVQGNIIEVSYLVDGIDPYAARVRAEEVLRARGFWQND